MRPIAGDSLEHSRIRLERDLDNTIPPPPSMSFDFAVPDDDVSSVDYPRHDPPHLSFHSFEHASHLDSDFYSRHGDEDSIALDPDLGYTMSTAAHHASALTLSAGLRGRGGYNHANGGASPSGAEYDPDRPLQAILDNRVVDAMSIFDGTSRSKSRNFTRTAPSFEPVVVDSTAELDRFLRTGHDRPTRLVYPYISRSHSQPTSDASDSEASQPRLAHALGRDFSPKRPRTATVSVKTTSGRDLKPKPVTSHPNPHVQASKPERSTKLPPQSEVAHKDSDATPRVPRKDALPAAPRAPFSELGNKHPRVRLPDVTGLTSAVQSPAKNDVVYADARVPATRTTNLLPALDALQTRLQALERANSISRRRVRELEHELEECRAEVLAERTRIEEREREAVHSKIGRHHAEVDSRYRAAVKEKKALEALLASLRAHLARLTEELSTHKAVIENLRTRAGHDARSEIQKLRTEVERLAGEVERLKAIVEEGLRERRRAKQAEGNDQINNDVEDRQQEMPAQVGIDLTYVTVAAQDEQQDRDGPLTMNDLQSRLQQERRDDRDEHAQVDESPGDQYYDPNPKDQEQELDDQEHGSEQNVEYHHESEAEEEQVPASKPQTSPGHIRRYIHASELARVEAEMRERRSERSHSTAGRRSRDNDSGNGSSVSDVGPAPTGSVPTPQRHIREGNEKENDKLSRVSGPPQQSPPQPVPQPRTPFPQIRGSHMERLFFSAPEHNVRTCAVCHRRKRQPPHLRECKKGEEVAVDTDEEVVRAYLRKRAQRSKVPLGRGDGDGDGDRPPPQTVLVRVVRELEDDFSHYKSIYLELAEQYGVMDAVSNVAKRNVLADHLRDVIDTLEQKGDQIAALYDLLSFQDRTLPRTQQQTRQQQRAAFA